MKTRFLLYILFSFSLFSSFSFQAMAAEADEDLPFGWIQQGEQWIYYEADGKQAYSKWILPDEDDGRGNMIYYYVDQNGFMAAGQTLSIDGTEYTFSEDGSLLVPGSEYQGAPRGRFRKNTFSNPWSGIKIRFPSIRWKADDDELEGYLEYFNDDDHLAIGKPLLTYDFQIEVSENGDSLELYYADMKDSPGMSAEQFADAMAEILRKTDDFTIMEPVSAATLGNHSYIKLSLSNDTGIQKDFYLRRQEGFMVVLTATAESPQMAPLTRLIQSITTPEAE